MSTVLRTPIVTSTSAEVNIMLRNSIKPIKCGPLRRGHNVQFSSEMTLPGGLRCISSYKPTCRWQMTCAVATVLWPCDINSNKPCPCCKDKLQIVRHCGEKSCFWMVQHTQCLADNLNDMPKTFLLTKVINLGKLVSQQDPLTGCVHRWVCMCFETEHTLLFLLTTEVEQKHF